MRGFLRRIWRGVQAISVVAVIAVFIWVLLESVIGGVPAALAENSVDRRLAARTLLFTVDALVFALAGVLIAMLAYSLSIQRPKMDLDCVVGLDNAPVPTMLDGNGMRIVAPTAYANLNLTLIVTNDVSAKNPAVRVSLGDELDSFHQLGEWSPTDWKPGGWKGAQWDGGVNYLVHSGFPRKLPPLSLGDARPATNDVAEAKVTIE